MILKKKSTLIAKKYFTYFLINMDIKILPTYRNNNNVGINIKNKYKVTYNKLPNLKYDTVSFSGVPNGEKLTKLFKYRLPDMYTGIPMLDPKDLEKIMKSRIFSSTLKEMVEYIKPYEDTLYPVEKQFWSYVKLASQLAPNGSLKDVVMLLYREHLEKLEKIQKPIFKELCSLAFEMPKDRLKEFTHLMRVTNKKLKKVPIIEKFSAKRFRYNLRKIIDEKSKRGNQNEILALKNLYKLSSELEDVTGQPYLKYDVVKNKIIAVNHSTIVYRQAKKIKKIENLFENSCLSKDEELGKLINSAKLNIFGIPNITNFNRKSFIYDLQKITDLLEDQKLAHKMVLTAIKLPTSRDNLSAFVVKAFDNTSEKIGLDLFSGSVASVEHLIPASKGGKDLLWNYGLASAHTNSKHSNYSFASQLEYYPNTAKNSQKLVNELIRLYKRGVFKSIRLGKDYITNFAKTLYKISPKNNRIKLDTHKLK